MDQEGLWLIEISKAAQLDHTVKDPFQKLVSALHWAVGRLYFASGIPLTSPMSLACGLASAGGAESPHLEGLP